MEHAGGEWGAQTCSLAPLAVGIQTVQDESPHYTYCCMSRTGSPMHRSLCPRDPWLMGVLHVSQAPCCSQPGVSLLLICPQLGAVWGI